jgi:hypothetical protein
MLAKQKLQRSRLFLMVMRIGKVGLSFLFFSHTDSPPALGLRQSLVALGATDDYFALVFGMLQLHFVAARNGDKYEVVCNSLCVGVIHQRPCVLAPRSPV